MGPGFTMLLADFPELIKHYFDGKNESSLKRLFSKDLFSGILPTLETKNRGIRAFLALWDHLSRLKPLFSAGLSVKHLGQIR